MSDVARTVQSYDEWLAESAPSLSRYFNRDRSLDWLDEIANPAPATQLDPADRALGRSADRTFLATASYCVHPDEVRDVYTSHDKPLVLESDVEYERDAFRAARAFRLNDEALSEGRIDSERHLKNIERIERRTGFTQYEAESSASCEDGEWEVRHSRETLAWLDRDSEPDIDHDDPRDQWERTRRGPEGEWAWTLEVLGQLRIDWREMRREAMRYRRCSASDAAQDPQVAAIERHAKSLRHRFNYRRYVAALAAEHLTAEDDNDRAGMVYAQQLALCDAWRSKNRLSYAAACERLAKRCEAPADRWGVVGPLVCAEPVSSPAKRRRRAARVEPLRREAEPVALASGPVPKRARVREDIRSWYFDAARRERLAAAGATPESIAQFYREREEARS